jgi:hypothetical protein
MVVKKLKSHHKHIVVKVTNGMWSPIAPISSFPNLYKNLSGGKAFEYSHEPVTPFTQTSYKKDRLVMPRVMVYQIARVLPFSSLGRQHVTPCKRM